MFMPVRLALMPAPLARQLIVVISIAYGWRPGGLHPIDGIAASKRHRRRLVLLEAAFRRVAMMLWRGIFAVLMLAAAALSAHAATVQQQAQPVELQPHAQLA
jgi:hypothetical protein